MRTKALFILVALLSGLFMVACNDANNPANHSNNIIPENAKIISLSDEMKLEENSKVGFNPNPLMVDTLSDNTIVIVNQAMTAGEIVTVHFTYIPENENPRDRVIKLHKSLYSLALYDNSGILLCGYEAAQIDSNYANLSIFSENFKLGVSAPIEVDGNLGFEVICNGEYAYTEFANEAVFDSAISTYENVHDNGYDRESLSPRQLELLIQLEDFYVSFVGLDEIDESDIEISKNLANNAKFKKSVGISDSGNMQTLAMPLGLQVACRIVKIMRKLHPGEDTFGLILDIAIIICDFLEKVMA